MILEAQINAEYFKDKIVDEVLSEISDYVKTQLHNYLNIDCDEKTRDIFREKVIEFIHEASASEYLSYLQEQYKNEILKIQKMSLNSSFLHLQSRVDMLSENCDFLFQELKVLKEKNGC